jgi:hypothetical protein
MRPVPALAAWRCATSSSVHRPPANHRGERPRQSIRPTPNRPGTHFAPSMRLSPGRLGARGSRRSLRHSTARWFDSSCSFALVRAHRNAGKPPVPSDSRTAGCRSGRSSDGSGHGPSGEVCFDHFRPFLAWAGGIEFVLEAIHHVRRHLGDVDVKLLIPTPKLIDGPVLLA